MRELIGLNLMVLALLSLLLWVYDFGLGLIENLCFIIGEALFFGVFLVGIYLIFGGM